MKKFIIIPAAIAAMALAGAANAYVVASTSFEPPAFPTLGPGQDQYGPDATAYSAPPAAPLVVPGFSFNGYSGIFSNPPLCCTPATPDGNQFGFIQDYNKTSSSIDWTVTGLTPGYRYALTFDDVGGSGAVTDNPLTVAFTGATTTDNTAFLPATDAWAANGLTFVASVSSVTISFVGGSLDNNALSGIDNLQVSSAPEPMTWTMMILGMGAVGAVLRTARRRRVAAV